MQKKQLEILFKEKYKPLIFLAHKLTGSLEDAEDIVADVFLRFAELPDNKLGINDNAGGFLYTAVKNKTLDFLKSCDRRKDNMRQFKFMQPEYIDASIIQSEVLQTVLNEIENISARKQKKIMRLIVDGFNQMEIAQILNMNVNTIATHIKRFRDSVAQLKQSLS